MHKTILTEDLFLFTHPHYIQSRSPEKNYMWIVTRFEPDSCSNASMCEFLKSEMGVVYYADYVDMNFSQCHGIWLVQTEEKGGVWN